MTRLEQILDDGPDNDLALQINNLLTAVERCITPDMIDALQLLQQHFEEVAEDPTSKAHAEACNKLNSRRVYEELIPSWDELSLFNHDAGCGNLVIISNCDKKIFDAALKLWNEDSIEGDLDTIIRRMGFFAITASAPNNTPISELKD